MPIAVTNPALQSLNGLQFTNFRIDDQSVNLTNSEVRRAVIENLEGKHEMAVVTTQLTKRQITDFVDKPVSFTYGPKTGSTTFYGYVVTINPSREYQVDTVVDITCMGMTWPMQNGTPKFVRSITAPDMFAAMVTRARPDISPGYGLGAQVDTHPYTWPVLAQSDESDWEFLLTLAHRIGYAVYNYQGVVRLVRPLRIITETPVFASFIKGDEVLDPTRTLLSWEASTQSMKLRQNIRPSFGFFDGDGVAVSEELARPYRLRTDTPIKDRPMATVYSSAWADRIDFWNNQATARINGNARIVPGVNIAVQVSGVPNGRNEYDGVWLVRGVKHSLTHNSFQTYLDLARDTSRSPINTNDRWFWNVDRGAPRITLEPNTRRWQSSWGQSPEYINDALS